MSNLGIDLQFRKVPSIVHKPSNATNNQTKPRNTHLPDHLSRLDKRKKNPNLQSIRSVSNHLANVRGHSPEKQNTLPPRNQLIDTRQKNRQSIGFKVPFANATNSKPIKSFSINTKNGKTQLQRQMNLNENNQHLSSPKCNQDSKEIDQKIHNQKPSETTQSSRKRIKTYRIHLSSSSKDKQNNINTHNRVSSISEQRQLLPIENLPLTHEKSQSYPRIDQDLVKKLVTNRQKSSHSFMIRKKINSTMLQAQQKNTANNNNKESSNTLHWSKCYRKDKFTKDEIVQVDVGLTDVIANNEFLQSTIKTNGRQKRAQVETNRNLPTQESQKSYKKLQAIKAGKSIKMRKKKFSKPQEDNIVYDEIFTQPNKNEKPSNPINTKFQKSSQDNFNVSKSRPTEYENKKLRQFEQLCSGNSKQEQKSTEKDHIDNAKPQLCQINAFYEMMCQYVPLKSRESQKEQIIQQSELIGSKGIKVCKKRVSSIRALKSLYRNAEVQQKTELAESRNGEFKKKQKETSCLTHKIKWGNQTKRKETQEQKNGILEDLGIQKNYHEEYLRLEIETININKITDNKKKHLKKARFMDEDDQLQRQDSGFSKKKSIDKKSQSRYGQFPQNSKPYQSIGSRSMIQFEDPGLSVIVKKNSSLQSSAHAYTTIEQQMSRSQNEQQDQCLKRKKKNKYHEENPKLQSLRELFLELKSYQSIQMEERL